ncbi:hypothetical protein K1X76_00695 [bacterium]|nr:hypothetical protein [bacterium]
MFHPWLNAFIRTQLVEMPIYCFALKGRPAVAFGASALTHPIVWFVIPHFMPLYRYAEFLIIAETFAIVAEAFYLKFFGLKKFWLWSVLANSISCAIGFLT